MLLKLYDWLFSTNVSNHWLVSSFQNAHGLFVPTCATMALLYYNITSDTYYFPIMSRIVYTQCGIDMLVNTKNDFLFHHVITMTLVTFLFAKPLEMEHVHQGTAAFLATELSTVFLVGREYLDPSSMCAAVNNVCFLTSFVFTRLYWLPRQLMFDPELHAHFRDIFTFSDYVWYYGAFYAFMGINLYWGSIIMKVTIKGIRSSFHSWFSLELCERLLQYTYALSPFVSFYAYIPYNGVILLDLFGQVLLANSSYYYHGAVYKALQKNKTIDLLTPSLYEVYFDDIIGIHLRSFLCVAVHMYSFGIQGLVALNFLGGLHLLCLYHFYRYMNEKKEAKQSMILGVNDDLFGEILRLFPVAVDISVTIYFSFNEAASQHNIMAFMCIFMCLYIQPAYEYNHLLLHGFLLYQTYALSKCNQYALEKCNSRSLI
jgi:hypothetical protein